MQHSWLFHRQIWKLMSNTYMPLQLTRGANTMDNAGGRATHIEQAQNRSEASGSIIIPSKHWWHLHKWHTQKLVIQLQHPNYDGLPSDDGIFKDARSSTPKEKTFVPNTTNRLLAITTLTQHNCMIANCILLAVMESNLWCIRRAPWWGCAYYQSYEHTQRNLQNNHHVNFKPFKNEERMLINK